MERTYTRNNLDEILYNFYIHPKNISELEKIKNENFERNIFYTINNFKHESRKFPNTKEGIYSFFYKYYYSINVLLHSLNAFLIDVYIDENKKNPQENWENIYKEGQNQNTIVKLFGNYLKIKNLKNEDNFLILSKLNIYENLFRHQISHGWIEIFFNINGNKKENCINEMFDKNFELNNKIAECKFNNNELNKFRIDLKKFTKKIDEETQDFNYVLENELQGCDENLLLLVEPVIKMKIKKKIKENTKENTKENESQEYKFSLNNLIHEIIYIANLIENNKAS